MISKLKQKLKGWDRIAGVEYILLGDGKVKFHVAILARKGQNITLEKSYTGIEDKNKLQEHISKDTPVVLSVGGRGVMSKRIEGGQSSSDQDLVSQLLPNAKSTDFFIQKTFQTTHHFVSIIRKNVLDEIIKETENLKLSVVGVYLSPWSIIGTLPVINDRKTIILPAVALDLENGQCIGFKNTEAPNEVVYKIEEDSFSNHILIAFSSAFNFLLAGAGGIEDEGITNRRAQFVQNKLIRTGGFIFLVFLFLILLVNYLLYLHYKDENAALAQRTMHYEGMLKEVKDMQKKITEKEYFLKSAGWLSTSRNSYYSDQIASIVPENIRLKELKVNPVNDRLSKKNKKIVFKSDTIVISGTCTNPTVLNPWMEEFKTKDWVEVVRNTGYTHDLTKKEGLFKLEAIIKSND